MAARHGIVPMEPVEPEEPEPQPEPQPDGGELAQLKGRLAQLEQASPQPEPRSDGLEIADVVGRGLESDSFSFAENQKLGDTRTVDPAMLEIEAIMAADGVGFDDARVKLNQNRMRANGIDPETGLSTDPLAVTPRDARAFAEGGGGGAFQSDRKAAQEAQGLAAQQRSQQQEAVAAAKKRRASNRS